MKASDAMMTPATRRRLVAWMGLAILCACESLDGAATKDGCQQVCWRVVPRLTNPEEGESQDYVSEECRCPDGFACTGAQTTRAGVGTRTGLGGYHDPAAGDEGVITGRAAATYKVCEPIDRQRPPALVFDFREGDLVPVTLRFRRGGGAWPASTPGTAGELTITPDRPRAPLVVPLPTGTDGVLEVKLPRGRHGVRLQMGRGAAFDPFNYPVSTLAGELVVERAGEAVIDIPATPFTFDVRLGSAPFPAPKTGESLALRIEGRYGVPGTSSNLVVLRRAAGQRLERGTIWLEPGKYTVTVISEGALTDPSLPTGFVIATRYLEIGATPLERIFDLRIVRLSGAITLDGQDLPAGADAEVGLEARDAVARAIVPPARPARYEVLAYGGEYDVVLATGPGAEAQGVPSGVLRAFAKKGLDGDLVLPIEATTLPWSAEVTANGAPLADAALDRGRLALEGGVTHAFSLGKQGPALVSAPVYRGAPAHVTVSGTSGGTLPALPFTVAAGFTPSATPARFDLILAPVRLELRIDGREPPASPAPRGFFLISRADDGASFRAAASTEGPLTTSVSLPPGTWKAVFQSASDAPGLPAGQFPLPELIVPREGLSRAVDVTSTEVVVELRRDGAPLPDATGSLDRGLVQVGATRVPLPRTGPARIAIEAFPGTTSVSVVCAETCGAGLPPFLTLVPLVRVGP